MCCGSDKASDSWANARPCVDHGDRMGAAGALLGCLQRHRLEPLVPAVALALTSRRGDGHCKPPGARSRLAATGAVTQP